MSNEKKDLEPLQRTAKGQFAKGWKPPPRRKKKQGGVTASLCDRHYELICDKAENGELENRDLITLFKYEYDQLYGKAVEQVQLTGKDGGPVEYVSRPETCSPEAIAAWTAAYSHK